MCLPAGDIPGLRRLIGAVYILHTFPAHGAGQCSDNVCESPRGRPDGPRGRQVRADAVGGPCPPLPAVISSHPSLPPPQTLGGPA